MPGANSERQPFVASSNQYYDTEAQMVYNMDDVDDPKLIRKLRHGFLRKVYGIVLTQLIVTSFFGVYLSFCPPARNWITHDGVWLMITAAVVSLVLCIVLVCVPKANQSFPTNYILLSIFTLAEAVAVGGVCASVALVSKTGASIVIQALSLTGIIVLGLTLFAFQTKYDFVSWMSFISLLFIGLLSFGLLRVFFPASRVVDSVYAAVAALFSCIYIVIDTQLLIGDKKIKFSEDQYIVAALSLYMDIVNLFIQLLKLLENSRNRN